MADEKLTGSYLCKCGGQIDIYPGPEGKILTRHSGLPCKEYAELTEAEGTPVAEG